MSLDLEATSVRYYVNELRRGTRREGPAFSRMHYFDLKRAVEDLQEIVAQWEAKVAAEEAQMKKAG